MGRNYPCGVVQLRASLGGCIRGEGGGGRKADFVANAFFPVFLGL